MAELVRQRHQCHAADPRLDIFFGNIDATVRKTILEHRVKAFDRWIDRDRVQPGAKQFGAAGGIVQTFLRCEARGHHHIPHPVCPQRIHRYRSGQRAVDTAGQSQDHAGEAVAVHIVPQTEDHCVVNIGRVIIELMNFARRASPFAIFTRPVRIDNRLVPVGQLVHHTGVTVQHETGAIEDDLVLPADPVQEKHRYPGFANPPGRHLPQAHVVLLDFIGTAMHGDKQIRTPVF